MGHGPIGLIEAGLVLKKEAEFAVPYGLAGGDLHGFLVRCAIPNAKAGTAARLIAGALSAALGITVRDPTPDGTVHAEARSIRPVNLNILPGAILTEV